MCTIDASCAATTGGNAAGAGCSFPFVTDTGDGSFERRTCVVGQEANSVGDLDNLWCKTVNDAWGLCSESCRGHKHLTLTLTLTLTLECLVKVMNAKAIRFHLKAKS